MQQGSGDYTSAYYPHQYTTSYPNPNPNPNDYLPTAPTPPSNASAPPYSHYTEPTTTTTYYPSPSAPSYSQPQPPQFTSTYPPYNPPPYQSDPTPPPYYTYPPPPPPPQPQPPTNPYENTTTTGPGGGYFDDAGNYIPAPTASNGYQDFYGERADTSLGYEQSENAALNQGAYAYDGGNSELYGARGTAPARSGSALFDDYGRSISFSSGGGDNANTSGKIVRAVPKSDAQEGVSSGAQKYRVKLLPEGAGSPQDVLCQVGLDGIRMLEISSNTTLKIYPLDTVTRCEVLDSIIFAFWSKSSVDIEPKRIRLKSNSYTSNTLLDTVTAATVQFKEMGGTERAKTADAGKQSDPNQNKKGFEWMNFAKPEEQEKDYWVPDNEVKGCTSCGGEFNAFNRRHHCRNCGKIFCDKCSQGRIALTADDNAQPVRVCDGCMAEVTHRLANAKGSANKAATLQSHEDLAKKLQEEMARNRKSSGSASTGSGKQMRDVACPTCTVHLQVQVPTSGSETVECDVCQHAFLVSAQ